MKFTIGLVGATNVGKSTLFNRLIGQFRAIVTDIPGTTTDILIHKMIIDGLGTVFFADSPGLTDFSDERHFIKKIIDESDLILFVIDDSVGITAKEQHIFSYIIDSNKKSKTLLIVNKLDIKRKANQYDLAICDYFEMGFENVIGISAKKENNVETIKDLITSHLKKIKYIEENSDLKIFGEEKKSDNIGIAILGKPNAGKSTLLNTFVGKYISKVEDSPGTTRDYLVGDFEYKGKRFTLYDTAGIRNKSKMLTIEKIAYQKTIDMLKFLRPIVVFMIDATKGVTHKDMTLLKEIYNIGLPLIFCLNKVDLLTEKQIKTAMLKTQAVLDFAKYIPIIPTVATTGKGQSDIMKMVIKLKNENIKRIETGQLNKILSSELIQRPPRFAKNKICKIFYATQIQIDAPTFLIFVNHKNRANFAFRKRVENSIRKNFGFIGIPIVIKFKERGEKVEE